MKRSITSLILAIVILSTLCAFAVDSSPVVEPSFGRGRLLTGYEYTAMNSASEGFVAAADKSGRWGFINSLGETAVPFEYDYCSYFIGGVAAVKRVGLWGFIDKKGNILCDFQFEDSGSFSGGFCAVKKDGLWGFIDEDFNLVIPYSYDGATGFSGGLASVRLGNMWGAIDSSGKVVIDFLYTDSFIFSGSIAAVNTASGSGIIDPTGKYIVSHSSGWEVLSCSENMAVLKKGNSYAIAGIDGRIIQDNIWQYVGQFSEKLAAVQINGKFGYINTSGQTVIPASFDSAGIFSGGLAQVSSGGKHGFVNTSGDLVIPCRFASVSPFHGATAKAVLDGVSGVIYRDGIFVPAAPSASTSASGLIPVKSGGLYAIFYDGVTYLSSTAYIGASAWALDSLSAADELGLLSPLPYDTVYSQPITRSLFCELVVSFYNSIGGSHADTIQNPFTDTNDIYVIQAYALGIVSGRYDGLFCPDEQITREEICVMLHRLCDRIGYAPNQIATPSFPDESQISSWAVASVLRISSAGITGGYDDGRFAPKDSTTIEQAVLILYRLASSEGRIED